MVAGRGATGQRCQTDSDRWLVVDRGAPGGVKCFRNYLQLFWEWLKLSRLLDNLSFRGMENLQVNVVQ
jgi:hypothetical protein